MKSSDSQFQFQNPVVSSKILQDGIVLTAIWLVITIGIAISNLPDGGLIFMMSVASISVISYLVSLGWIIPKIKEKGKGFDSYVLEFFKSLFFLILVVFLFTSLIYHGIQQFLIIAFINVLVQLIIVAPVAWLMYNHRASKASEITGLKTALKTSSANIDFLRSQINPHFLFNALNTLYGTALQENAPRASEGIQMLGDMMRFMLQENLQETIPLNREIDYLKNYISLQKLRIQTSPDIIVQTEIGKETEDFIIAPMILIPFVENAFKHGISLRQPSYINISLQTEGSLLKFDIHNSIHIRTGHDTEQHSNGIGLENVKQRLQLLYPNRHELIIRETLKDFFIHLTLQL